MKIEGLQSGQIYQHRSSPSLRIRINSFNQDWVSYFWLEQPSTKRYMNLRYFIIDYELVYTIEGFEV